ncbi:uncharacterized protein E0L32_004905 [Thyridium curvatum]|uniref:Uncharacterized protein n=1 Tax=Thyridium curvatum TaxID=1093900 RepID=A0A507AWC4_9PEZI|nr:uncharacterized protein E0L32_004905 [Thyridium curvatum]TPX15075.1 hypothetical protein E0L32_004905 [Thyridium curvatum]
MSPDSDRGDLTGASIAQLRDLCFDLDLVVHGTSASGAAVKADYEAALRLHNAGHNPAAYPDISRTISKALKMTQPRLRRHASKVYQIRAPRSSKKADYITWIIERIFESSQQSEDSARHDTSDRDDASEQDDITEKDDSSSGGYHPGARGGLSVEALHISPSSRVSRGTGASDSTGVLQSATPQRPSNGSGHVYDAKGSKRRPPATPPSPGDQKLIADYVQLDQHTNTNYERLSEAANDGDTTGNQALLQGGASPQPRLSTTPPSGENTPQVASRDSPGSSPTVQHSAGDVEAAIADASSDQPATQAINATHTHSRTMLQLLADPHLSARSDAKLLSDVLDIVEGASKRWPDKFIPF